MVILMKNKSHFTRTRQTEINYGKRGNSILKRLIDTVKSVHGRKKKPSCVDINDYLNNLAQGRSPASYRQDKASLAFLFESLNEPQYAALVRNHSRDLIEHIHAPKQKNTSSIKQKKVSYYDRRKLNRRFRKNRKKFYSENSLKDRTYLLYNSILLTGIRPCEWINTRLINDYVLPDGTIEKHVLEIKNAKNTNNRANGDYRHIVISDLNDDEKRIIFHNMLYITRLRDSGGDYAKYQKSAKDQMYLANKALWPKRKTTISLYSFRHQFAADYKKAGYTKSELAALMGHAADDTASRHYGRKVAGRKGRGLVRPLVEEVNTVRKTSKPSPFNKGKGPKLR